MAVGVNDLTPTDSVSGVIDSVLDLIHIGDSLSQVPLGALFVVAVLDIDQSLIHGLSHSASAEAGENTLLVQSNGLSLLVLDLFGSLNLLCHSCVLIMIIQ